MTFSPPQLPKMLAEIVEVVGGDAALAVADAQGGQYARIPSRLDDDHWLVQAIGRELAERLSFHFLSGRGRIDVYIPLGPAGCVKAEQDWRAATIRNALEAGMSIGDISRLVGLSRRAVHRHKAKLAAVRRGALKKVS